MPPLKEVLLAPYFKDINDYDCKVLELDRDVTCGDILCFIARELGLRRKDLALMGTKIAEPVRFHPKEPPIPFMQVKGVQSLDELPNAAKVKSQRRSGLTLEQAMQIQEELLEVYSDEVFVLMMMRARKACRLKWEREGELNTKEYTEKMKSVLEYAQEKVLPKWGYDPTPQGMLTMQGHFAPWDPLPEVFSNVELINRKLGFDYTWVSQSEEEEAISGKNFAQGGKLKMLFLYGGGTNKTVAQMQCANVFRDSPMYSNMEFTILEAPHESNITWHLSPIMQTQLKPFGETIYLYFDRVPYANSQFETWVGIDDSLQVLKSHLRKKGPYDGVVGFDMGGEVLLQAAQRMQQGEAGFKGMFRFMVLFTSAVARRLSGDERPKAPLEIPAVLSWAYNDENHTQPQFEESALHFVPETREIINHGFGHIPPRLSKTTAADELNRLTDFLTAMWTGEPWKPSQHPDNEWAANLKLPLVQRIAPEPIPPGGKRRLLVVHDPMGAHEYETIIKLVEEAIRFGQVPEHEPTVLYKSQGTPDNLGEARMNLAVCTLTAESFKSQAHADIAIEAVEYTAEQRAHDWHVAQHLVPPGPMKREDIIKDDKFQALAESWAKGFLAGLQRGPGERLGIVGLGTGAFLALAAAKLLVAEGAPPAGVWVVDPPTCLPRATTKQPGALAGCPVSVLTNHCAKVGPPWSYEVSTRGPFSEASFEQVEDMISTVIGELAALYDDGERDFEERKEVEEKARREAEERAAWEAEEAARHAAERAARQEAEARARREKEEREAAERARREAEAKARQEEEERVRKEAEEKARQEAEEQQRKEALRKEWVETLAKSPLEARCAAEFAKTPTFWMPVTMDQLQENHAKKAPGMIHGFDFPFTAEQLEKMGPAWLTKAFHAATTIPKDNKVTRIKNIREFVGGGNCSKLLFEVEYEKASEDLHTKLFAKIPYPLAGKTSSDRMSSSVMLQGSDLNEINTYRLLESRFPFRIPKYYFGDISNVTTNWILITERVLFGEKQGPNQLDPAYDKMKDWELKGPPEEYYYLLIRAGAKLAGLYKLGALASLETLHKFYDSGVRGPEMYGMSPESTGMADGEFKVKIKMGAEFVDTTGKALFPEACTTPDFIKTFKTVLATANAYSAEITWWCSRDPDYVAWSHSNLNVDNVWFWRDAAGKLDVGCLDWGGACCNSLGTKLWWWLYCSEFAFLNEHLEGMLDCFIEEYHACGGPQLDKEELLTLFLLSALTQACGLLGAVPQIYRMCPKKQWPTIKDRRDPRIAENVDGKNTLRIYIGNFINICNMINEWGIAAKVESWTHDITAATGIPKKKVVVT